MASSNAGAVTLPARRGKAQQQPVTPDETADRTPAERHAAMTWAQRLKRVCNTDIETCQACGGACIEDPGVIRKILDHVDRLAATTEANGLPEPRAPPQAGLFDSI